MKRLVLAVLLILVSACTTFPPPKIENSIYHNAQKALAILADNKSSEAG
ncbi:MAG: hypothetical protein V3W52_08295 [Syntrophobacteria bacterium]